MKKIIFSLVAIVAVTAAAFAAQKALVITLKDGTTATYNLDQIDNLHFSKASLPMGDPTTGPYAPGDYYCDGTIQGIVVTVDKKGNYGTLCSLVDLGNLNWATWGDYEWVETGANNEDDGKVNQQIIAALEPSFDHYPAFGACADEGTGWYLPAIHEIQALSKVLDEANATLESLGYPQIDPSDFYWSSTEAVEYTFADGNAMGIWMDFVGQIGTSKNSNGHVRAFHDFGEIPPRNFTVGELYDKDGVKGIVCWVDEDDTYARVISMDETSATWGPKGTLVGAASQNDGEANTKAVRKANATFSSYPAFAGCDDPWYLPAMSELQTVAENLDAINAGLTSNGGTAISASDFYWSSSEVTADYSYQVHMGTGTSTNGSKDTSRKARRLAYVGDRPIVESYSIGDAYYDGNVVVGIVCGVSDDGQHGVILALQNVVQTGRINAFWANSPFDELEAGASSMDDGEYNLGKFRELDATLANFPALSAATAMGDGWYIGAYNEMVTVAENISVINAAMTANGGRALENNDYWTSTEIATDPANRIHTVNPVSGKIDDFITRKYGAQMVRPMKKF